MPKRTDIQSILIIGAGPIVIGQACEFDYSGTQACRALKEEGYRIILINSNPATIMTDPEMADATYIEPITPEFVEKIIEIERPDAILPTMGGQTALNIAMKLAENGVLEKYNVQMIGANKDAIERAEDRLKFKDTMDTIGLSSPKSVVAHNLTDAQHALDYIGLPAIIRPSFTLGGTGGGIAYNKDEYLDICRSGLDASPTTEILVEESVLGWKEYEMEVVRDKNDNCIIICAIENIDPMGVHTGDSITVAPALTLTDKEYQNMRNASIAVLRAIGVETGGSNVQFAINPNDGRMVVIEMNPRVSRSSALASKATGFPIAKVAAKLAVGYTLDELDNDITKATPASFEPTLDYVITKIPRFTFEKFPGTQATLTTAMKSVGETMGIGRNFAESLQKALRSLETGLMGLDTPKIEGFGQGDDKNALLAELAQPSPQRLLVITEAIRFGIDLKTIYDITHYDTWFLEQLETIVNVEKKLIKNGLPQTKDEWLSIKRLGFGDDRIAFLLNIDAQKVREARHHAGVRPVFKRVDTCSAEFESKTPYMYSTYEYNIINEPDCEAEVSHKTKIAILGGGPNRIGQGIEFDYCCCHACFALTEAGYETIMINCNPETVSTDYDTSDRLYFEPLTDENVIEILQKEQQKGKLLGVICQFGGQTPLRLAKALEDVDIPILGTLPDAIDLAEDRERFQQLLHKLELKQPENGIARSFEEAKAIAEAIHYPVVIRPSYVLGGRAMEIIHNVEQLQRYMKEAVVVSGKNSVLIDKYLSHATEVDVDALCDGKDVFVAGIMEHIEEAGIHSGDSSCSLPPYSLPENIIDSIRQQTIKLAKGLNVVGLINIQFAVQNQNSDDAKIYVLEVNPRASRTVPFVAKATGIPIAKIAARIMAGESLSSFKLQNQQLHHVAVKEAVFPFSRFPGVDILLGPEMRSTGEVMGIDTSFDRAFLKSQLAAGSFLPKAGNVFISVRDSDKLEIISMAKTLQSHGYKLFATRGTADYLRQHTVEVTTVNKVMEGRPHIVDMMKDGNIHLVLNTVDGVQAMRDSFSIRSTALSMKVPYYTTISGAKAAVQAMSVLHKDDLNVVKLQAYH